MVELDQTSMPQFKRCSKCKGFKEVTEFRGNKSKKYGYSGQCKSCEREDKRKYYQTERGREVSWIANHKRTLNGKDSSAHKSRYHELQEKYGYYGKVIEWYPGARVIEALETAPIVEIKA